MYKEKLHKLSMSLAKNKNFGQAKTIVKLAISLSESFEKIKEDFESRETELEERGVRPSPQDNVGNITEQDLKVIIYLIDEQIKSISSPNKPLWLEGRGCSYCGAPILNREGVSLDRVDNQKGYTLGNIVFSCSRCNLIKANSNIYEFLDATFDISNNLKSKNNAYRKIQQDAYNLQKFIREFLSSDLATNEEFQQAIEKRQKIVKGKGGTYTKYINQIIESMHEAVLSTQWKNADQLFDVLAIILDNKFRSETSLNWSKTAVKAFILRNFETILNKINDLPENNIKSGAKMFTDILQEELLGEYLPPIPGEKPTTRSFQNTQSQFFTINKNLNQSFKGLQNSTLANLIENINIDTDIYPIINTINNLFNTSLTTGTFLEFISIYMPPHTQNVAKAILNKNKDALKDLISRLKQEGTQDNQIYQKIHKVWLNNIEGGRKVVQDFIKENPGLFKEFIQATDEQLDLFNTED